MNRKERARSGVKRIVGAARAKLCGGETAGPVVDVNDIGRRTQSFEKRQSRATEESESLMIVTKALD